MINMVEFNKKRIASGKAPEKQTLHAAFMGNPGTGKPLWHVCWDKCSLMQVSSQGRIPFRGSNGVRSDLFEYWRNG